MDTRIKNYKIRKWTNSGIEGANRLQKMNKASHTEERQTHKQSDIDKNDNHIDTQTNIKSSDCRLHYDGAGPQMKTKQHTQAIRMDTRTHTHTTHACTC